MALTQIGKYKVLARIGQGAMGEVFRALDTSLHREVAVKTMTAAIGGDAELRRRFMREAQSAARLNHPNIVTVYDFGEDEGQVYMAMELLQGRDLKELIRSGRIETLDDALPLMEQICDGVGFAHAQQLVHRDLKPGNIHVLPNGQVKILDFGLARMSTSDMTKTGMMLGTPNYMSPEQVRGEHVDIRSDVFSVGAVFYEMLAGHKAFEEETLHAVLFAVASKDPEPLSVANPELPAVVARIVEHSLAKDPTERFQHAGQMSQAFGVVRDFFNGYIDEATALHRIGALRAQSVESMSTRAYGPNETATLVGEASGSSGSPRSGRHPIPRPTWTGGPARLGSGGSGPRSSPTGAHLLLGSAAPWIWIAGVTAVLGLVTAGWFVFGPGRSRDQPAPADTASHAADAANDVLLEGARKDLQYGNFRGALEAANKVLSADPNNPEAHRIAEAASEKLEEIAAAAEALAAARAEGRRDKGKADLEKLMALDPGHPQVDQSTKWLNEMFLPQARQAQDRMKRAADQARRVPRRDSAQYDRAMSLNRDAETLINKGQYAEAAQKFAEAGNLLGKSLAPPRMPPIAVVIPTPPEDVVRLENHPAAAIPAPSPTPPVVMVAPPTPTFAPTPRPAPPTSLPALPVNTDDADIRRVIHGLASAIETGNITLYKQLRPSLSSADERRLRDSFSRVRQRIVVDIRSIEVDGNHAIAQVGWTVTVPGERPAASIQRYGLAKGPAGWYIERVN